MSRRLRWINLERAKQARREYWDRDPDTGAWTSYQTDHELHDDELMARAATAVGAEAILVFDKTTSP